MAAREGGARRGRAAFGWAARGLVAVSVVAGIAMQVQSGEWLPPEHSLSQYANGPGSTAFAIALLALGLSAAAVAPLVPRAAAADRAAAVLLLVAGAGFVLAVVVAAPAVGDEDPVGDALHQAGAIAGTFGLSIGGLILALRYRHSVSGRCLLVAAVLGGVALLLLTLANFDIDVIGLGRRAAWALHQSVSLICMVLILALLPSALRDRGRSLPYSDSDRQDGGTGPR